MILKSANFLTRLALGAIFILAGAEKVFDPKPFGDMVAGFQMLPNEFVNLIAIILPWLELTTGLFLVLGTWVRASALVGTLLSAVFLAAVTQAIARGLDIKCGCFGKLWESGVGLPHVGLDAAMLAASLWLLLKVPEHG